MPMGFAALYPRYTSYHLFEWTSSHKLDVVPHPSVGFAWLLYGSTISGVIVKEKYGGAERAEPDGADKY